MIRYVNSPHYFNEMSVRQVLRMKTIIRLSPEVWSLFNTKFSFLTNKELYGISWENEWFDREYERVNKKVSIEFTYVVYALG